jgi:tetratricopeptide (TPR) repeat protein
MNTIRAALEQLQQDSDSKEAWQSLQANVEKKAARDLSKIHDLFELARADHMERHEWWAVAQLLALEIAATPASPGLISLTREYGMVQLRHLYDEGEAANAFSMVIESDPKDKVAKAELEESAERRASWEARAAQYLSEAEGASDDEYKSSMLMRVAEMELRFGGADVDPEVVEKRLLEACKLDADNEAAFGMVEYFCRRAEDWQKLAGVLEQLVGTVKSPQTRVIYGLKLARVALHRLSDRDRAAAAYQHVLEAAPAHAEASSFLADYHAQRGAWQELVRVYERRLDGEPEGPERLGDMLQIALLYWRKLNQPSDAEPWFERVRKIEPGNSAVLDFFTDYLKTTGDETRLEAILQSAEKVLSGKEKRAISQQLSALKDGQKGAQVSIEQLKAQLRQDPGNGEIRTKLKELYTAAGSYNALVELLRQQFERTPADEQEQRLAVLREVADVYRQHMPADPALASVLGQIATLDPSDTQTLRELCTAYERLARWRDLLSCQQKLAEVSTDTGEKVELLRGVAKRWLDQFSNVQNATAAYESLLAADPTDRDAQEQLQELYTKRRAWPQLYELYAAQAKNDVEPAAKVTVLRQMAQLCAERLGRPQEAMQLYQQIVELDAGQSDVAEALEKQAERAKDWPTLAAALERRLTATEGADAQVTVLQKLAAIYADQLGDADQALNSWRRIVELQPGHTRALRSLREAYLAKQDFDALEELYTSQSDPEGLAEVLGHAADKAEDAKLKIELSYRAARVYSEVLAQPTRAFRSYERILTTDPKDAKAAGLLIPIYEQDEKWARLPALYDVLVAASSDAAEQTEYLKKAVQITGGPLGDRQGSLAYARRAFETNPDDGEVLGLFEKAALATGKWDSFAEALSSRLAQLAASGTPPPPEVTSENRGKRKKGKDKKERREREQAPSASPQGDGQRREIALKLAHICDANLGQAEKAAELLRAELERDPTDVDIAGRLEAILRREGKRDELRWVLELKVEHAPSDSERVALLAEWATLEENVFKDLVQAGVLYQRLLQLEPGHIESLRALARLLLAGEQFEMAATVIESSLESLSGLERAEMEVLLAQLYLEHLGQPQKAFEHAVGTLKFGSHDTRAIALLERLVQVDATREKAAQVLATEYAEVGDARHEVEALQAMLTASKDADERFSLLARLASIQEQKLDSVNAAFDTLLRAVREFPGRLELWDQAEELASRAARAGELAEAFRETVARVQGGDLEVDICERAARLHQDKLGDPNGAVPYLERILKRDPGNSSAFSQLKNVLTASERWGELAGLYDLVIAQEQSAVAQIELLLEVALLCEEITEDLAGALRYYERIHELDPQHESASKALDRMYQRLGKDKELATLLEQRIPEADADRTELQVRLAALYIDKLHRPADAVGYLDTALEQDVNEVHARQLTEKLLLIGSVRADAARILERVYEARNEARELARVLDIQLALLVEQGASKPENADLHATYKETLLRVARLKDARLHDDAGAFAAFAEYLPLEAMDVDARSAINEIAGRLSNFSALIEVLERSAGAIEDPAAKAELLLQAAQLCEQRLQDANRAQGLFSSVTALHAEAPEPAMQAAKALDRSYSEHGKDAELAAVLRLEIDLELSDQPKRELQARLANLFETRLSKVNQAIKVWKERLDADASDLEALRALDRLYESTGRWADLVPILKQRHEQTSDAAEQRDLLVRQASVLSERLNDDLEAIGVWSTLLESFGNDAAARDAIEQLYAKTERWNELADSYLAHAEVAADNAQRIGLWRKLGDLRVGQLADPAAALDAYREGLTLDQQDSAIREALEKLLSTEDIAVRRDAAAVLRAVYEAEHNSSRLLGVLEVQVAASDDPLDKVELLQLASRVADKDLSDTRKALTFAQSAVKEGAGHADLAPLLAELDRLSAIVGERAQQVSLLREVVEKIFDGDLKYDVTLRVAVLARDELSQADLARDYFEQASQLDPSRQEPLLALEALYQAESNWAEVLRVLERRIDASTNDAERQTLLFSKARLLAKQVAQPGQAIESYEAIIQERLEPEAVAALEGLYQSEGRYGDLITLLERQLDAEPAKEADFRVKMAQILADQQSDLNRALDEVEAALKASAHHAGATAFLTRVVDNSEIEAELRGRAAELLEPIHLASADYDRVMKVLTVRLESLNDPTERRVLLLRLAKLHEEQKEDYLSAIDTVAKLFHEDITDTQVSGELERLARVADAKPRLGEIYASELKDVEIQDAATAALARRTGELLTEQGQDERALGFLERALSFEPDSVELFALVDKLMERMGRHRQRVELYQKTLDQRYEPAERLQLLHAIARLERQQLRDLPRAIEAYVQALDVDEKDAISLEALGELYRETEQFSELAEHYLRRAELAEQPSEQAEHRMLLARLARTRLNDTQRAIDQLEEITRIVPQHAAAIAELEGLRDAGEHRERVIDILRPIYEQSDSWQRLISLNEDRLSLTEDLVDRLGILKDNAELWEKRGHAPERARVVLGKALDLDPNDVDARQSYERLVEQTQGWSELAERYERLLQIPDLVEKREYLVQLARAYDRHLNDPRSALRTTKALFELEPDQSEHIEKLEGLALMLGDWHALVMVLEAKVDTAADDAERASIWRQVAEIQRDMLQDIPAAVQAGERTLDVQPGNLTWIDFLIELHQQHDQPERLVELCAERLDVTDASDVERRYELLLMMVDSYDGPLKDPTSAVERLEQALEAKPGDPAALQRLAKLHRTAQAWPEYVATLSRVIDGQTDVGEKAKLLKEVAAVQRVELSDLDESLATYRRVLELSPADDEAIKAAFEIGRDEETTRSVVADLLVPLLSGRDQAGQLIEVLRLRLSTETEPPARVATLQAIAGAQERQLQDVAGALTSLLSAAVEMPDDAQLHQEIERLCDLTGNWADYATMVEERAGATFDSDLGRELWLRLGRIAEEKLKDAPRAIMAFGKAIEQVGDQPALLEALDRLYTTVDDHQALADVLERRLAFASSGPQQGELHARMARVYREKFNEPARAMASLKLALECDPAQQGAVHELERLAESRDLFEEASETLEAVYRSRGQTDRLASLFEKRVSFADTPAQRAEMRRGLAGVLEQELNDAAAAQRVLQQGLKEEPTDSELLAEIERLAGKTADYRGAAAAIEQAVTQSPTLDSTTARDLLVKASAWYRDQAGDAASALAALFKAIEHDATNDDVLQGIERLQRETSDNRGLLETLQKRARLQVDPIAREQLYRQVVELAPSADPAAAETALRELLKEDDRNAWALQTLQQLCEAEGNHKEAFKLLERRIELTEEAHALTTLRHQAASMAREKLNKPKVALELYGQLFEHDPADTVTSAALRELYTQGKHWDDLRKLLERLIDVANTPAAKNELRLELAELCRGKLKDVEGASEALRSVLRDDPAQDDAAARLATLYSDEEQYGQLASLWADRIAVAEQRGDQAVALKLRLQLAELQEQRLQAPGEAIATLEAILARDASQLGALKGLVGLLRAEKRTADLVQRLAQLIEVSPRDEALALIRDLAEAQRSLGDKAGEIATLEKGLALEPSQSGFREQLLLAYEQDARWDKLAELICSNAEQASTADQKVALYRQAARVHAEKRADAAMAAAVLAKATEVNPNDRELMLELCDAYTRSGRAEESVRVLEQIVESFGGRRHKDLVDVHRRLAAAYQSSSRTDQAVAELDKAFRIEPGNMNVLKDLGLLSIEVGDFKKAQQMFRALLLQKFEGNTPLTKAEVFYHLAEVHERLGEKDKALSQAERAVQTDPKLDKARELVQRLKG